MESIAALGVSSTLLASPAATRLASLSPSRKKKGKLTVDEDLVCIISDLHVRPGKYQQQHFVDVLFPHHLLLLQHIS